MPPAIGCRTVVGAGLGGLRKVPLRRVLLSAALFVSLPAAAPAAVPLSWSLPRLIDRQSPLSVMHAIGGVSCGSAELCAAVDDGGNILTSTAPASGAWKLTRGVDVGAALRAIACPARSLCVAVDSAGSVLTSTAPVGGAWKTAVGADPQGDLRAISCPSIHLCVAVDGHGNALTSTGPAGGKRAWRLHRVLASRHALEAIACPSATLCVALGADGFATTTAPADAWRLSPYPDRISGRSAEFDVSCPSRSLCVAAVVRHGFTQHLLTTTRPAAPNSWTARRVRLADQGAITSLSCPSRTLCVAGDDAADIVTGAPAGPWHVTTIHNPTINGFDDVVLTCPRSTLCVGGDAIGLALSSTQPTAGTSAWKLAPVDQSNAIRGVSCTSASFCAAADSAGNVLSTSDPRDAAPSWTATHLLEQGEGFGALACIAAPLCVAGATSVPALTASGNPTGGAGAWHEAALDNQSIEINGISCPTASLCVAVDFGVYTDSSSEFSSIDTSTNPTGGDSAWTSTFDQASFSDPAVLEAVSCPSITLCVAVDSRGNVVASTAPIAREVDDHPPRRPHRHERCVLPDERALRSCGPQRQRAQQHAAGQGRLEGCARRCRQPAERGVMRHCVAVRRCRSGGQRAQFGEPRGWRRCMERSAPCRSGPHERVLHA